MRCALLGLLLLATPPLSTRGHAADDVVIVDPLQQADAAANQGVIAVENFDQWIFQNCPNGKEARSRLKNRLQIELDHWQQLYDLQPAQVQHLKLAGQGDLSRFFDDVELVRLKFLKLRNDPQRFNDIWQEISPLQIRFQQGVIDRNSLIHKSLHAVLNPAQQQKLAQVEAERRTFLDAASRLAAIELLEQSLPLMRVQRERLLALLERRAIPRVRLRQTSYLGHVVLIEMAKLDESDFAKIFDEQERIAVKQAAARFNGWEQFLMQQGMMDNDPEDFEEFPAVSAHNPENG